MRQPHQERRRPERRIANVAGVAMRRLFEALPSDIRALVVPK